MKPELVDMDLCPKCGELMGLECESCGYNTTEPLLSRSILISMKAKKLYTSVMMKTLVAIYPEYEYKSEDIRLTKMYNCMICK
jgi:hypothetical protein